MLAYFANIQPIMPIVHMPMFRPSTQNGLLLLSICSIGSLFLGSPKATAHGINMYERLNKAILSRVWTLYLAVTKVIYANNFQWDIIIASLGPSGHFALQASIIGQMFGLLVGVSSVPTMLIV